MANQHTKKKAEAPVTRAEFEQLNSAVLSVVEMLQKNQTATATVVASVPAPTPVTPDQKKQDAAIESAGPNKYSTDDEWDAIARDIIGEEYIDHTEVERKGGGVKFTVVIKFEKSNASTEYLQRMKIDRRTKEVGSEGTEGVTQYCKLIRANLTRPKR